MRRLVLIVLAVVVTAGVVYGVNRWVQIGRANADRDQHVQHALEIGQTEEGMSAALQELEAVLKSDPDHVDALENAGDLESQFKHFANARRYFQHAADVTKEEPRHAQLLFKLGQACGELYRASGSDVDFRAARTAYQDASLEPSVEPEATEAFGWLFYAGPNRNWETMRTSFEKLLRAHPDYEFADRVRGALELLQKSAEPKSGG